MANRGDCKRCGLPIDGAHYSYCKACFAAYIRARYVPKQRKPAVWNLAENRKQKAREWYEKNRERIRDEGKQARLQKKAAVPEAA